MNKKEEIRNRRVSECVFKYSNKKILAMKTENPFLQPDQAGNPDGKQPEGRNLNS